MARWLVLEDTGGAAVPSPRGVCQVQVPGQQGSAGTATVLPAPSTPGSGSSVGDRVEALPAPLGP